MSNKILTFREPIQTFEPSGGNITFSLENTATLAGQISNQWDRGTGALEDRFVAIMRTQFLATVTAGQTIDLYVVEGWAFRDATVREGGDLPGVDTAIADLGDIEAGGRYIGNLRVPIGSAINTEYVSLPAYFTSAAQYLQIAIWNATQGGLTTDATEHEIAVYRVPPEIQ